MRLNSATPEYGDAKEAVINNNSQDGKLPEKAEVNPESVVTENQPVAEKIEAALLLPEEKEVDTQPVSDEPYTGESNAENNESIESQTIHQEVQELTPTAAQKHTVAIPFSTSSDIPLIILVILAIIIPPLAVALFEGITTRFWIDLVLALVGWSVGWALVGLGLAALCGLAAVIYAVLIVLSVI